MLASEGHAATRATLMWLVGTAGTWYSVPRLLLRAISGSGVLLQQGSVRYHGAGGLIGTMCVEIQRPS